MSYAAMNHHIKMAEECCREARLDEAERHLLSGIEAVQSVNAYLAERMKAAAIFYLAQDDFAKAEPLFERLLETERKLHGPESFPVCRALVYQALFYYKAGRYAQAKPCLDEALAALRRAPYQRQPCFDARLHYFCLHLLGMAHGALGDAESARKHCQEAAQVVGRNAGPGGGELRSDVHEANLKNCECHTHPDSRATCEWLISLFLDQLQRDLLGEVIRRDVKENPPASFEDGIEHWIREMFVPNDGEWRPASVHRSDSSTPVASCIAKSSDAWRA